MYGKIKNMLESETPGRVRRGGDMHIDLDELSKHADDYGEFKKTMNELEENVIEIIKSFTIQELIYFLIERERSEEHVRHKESSQDV